MHRSVESCFPSARALHFEAPGGGAFSASALALQFDASVGENFTVTLVLAIQRGRCKGSTSSQRY
jgi:hypothetical protein